MKNFQKITFVVLFGIFFGLLEAIVVIYLRQLFGSGVTPIGRQITPDDIALTLGFITFLKSSASSLITQSQWLLSLERWRELSTLVMLATLSFIAGKTIKEKFAYFLLVFGVWDIFYYIFLKIVTGWPAGFFEPDVYFLIPTAWVGPVITPLMVSSIMILLALFLLLKGSKKP
ncbi:MAG: hypothetical protein UT85_C0007G0006 [Candidatus Levybacteria bacterium GW2011_GWA2_40_16]|uniref:Uncharacterized protein n=1 Tax=Candidatus Roizmanbacteria bacterium GW2011_GWA1_41_13 TaxID=1618474 RepID=A0A0G0XUF4_9BACT|nr:MAG: hypothetical protein UT85_C0007G0006 [Candidatus Levybacteria bacterium GW2011_GWA2_40_16]KKR91547.1 MAG: hypothetical protein UU41_C0035G0012 [Candidatus Roizmanbacteria bacterium GW2011_GWA1_41_13]